MKEIKIAVIGLGYVGLPLARLFATKYSVVGFDLDKGRVDDLISGNDYTLEVSKEELKSVIKKTNSNEKGLFCTSSIGKIRDCNYYIVTVPTPVDENNNPLLVPLKKASETVGMLLDKDDIVIYESTVYPGATQEECVPILEKKSGMKLNSDFFIGYSPERINPGDKVHTLANVLKITSGSTLETAKKVDALYRSVIEAGTYMAPSIKVAEAAKVIENTQRDINIAFVNELAKIFSLMNIDTHQVLDAAKTKWNFLPFEPGLVGGHCIGVDPYYLAQKAQELGYYPEIILAGRKINDSMGTYIASEVVKLMLSKDIKIRGASVLILGITFKENCIDVRNSRVVDIVLELKNYKTDVTIFDPWADKSEVKREYNLKSYRRMPKKKFDAIILAVAHDAFKNLDLSDLRKEKSVVYDVKNCLPVGQKDKNL